MSAGAVSIFSREGKFDSAANLGSLCLYKGLRRHKLRFGYWKVLKAAARQTWHWSGRTGVKKLFLSLSFLSWAKCFSTQRGSVQSHGNGLHPAEMLQRNCSLAHLYFSGKRWQRTVAADREWERNTKLYLLYTFIKLANPLPNQSSHSHLHPAVAVSVGHFQVGERLQISVVAILGMLFYRLDLLWFGWNERVWHKISKSQTQTDSFSGPFAVCFFSRETFHKFLLNIKWFKVACSHPPTKCQRPADSRAPLLAPSLLCLWYVQIHIWRKVGPSAMKNFKRLWDVWRHPPFLHCKDPAPSCPSRTSCFEIYCCLWLSDISAQQKAWNGPTTLLPRTAGLSYLPDSLSLSSYPHAKLSAKRVG